MSRELVMYVERKVDNNKYELLRVFNGENKDVTDTFLWLNSARDILVGNHNILDGYMRGMPKFPTEEVAKWGEVDHDAITWYDWCELILLARLPEANEIEWEEVEEDMRPEEYPRYNYLKNVVSRISILLELNDIYSFNVMPGEIRVVCCLSY